MGMVKKGDRGVVASPSDPNVGVQSAAPGLTPKESERLERELGRKPSPLELEVAKVLWSERCAYKSSRLQLKRLPTSGQHVVAGPGDNAGALDIGDNEVAVLRIESHALGREGRGETIRTAARVAGDVMASGARPQFLLDGLLLGRPDADRTRTELRAATSALGEYCTRTQTPGVGGFVELDREREGVPELTIVSLGVTSRDSLFVGRSGGLGSKVIYAGAPRSEELDLTLEKPLRDGLARVFRSGHVEGAEDIDVGGLAAAAVELAARGNTGIELDLDALPGSEGIGHVSLLTEERCQRFLLIAKKGREDAVVSLLSEAGLMAAAIGVVTNTQRFVCKGGGNDKSVLLDLSVGSMTSDAPYYERPLTSEAVAESTPPSSERRPPDPEVELLRMVGSPAAGSRQWIARQLDGRRDVPSRTSDAALVSLPREDDDAEPKLLALSLECGVKQAGGSIRTAAQLAVAECARNVVCTGAEPIGLIDAIVTGDPDDTSYPRALAECIEGLREASLALKLPVVAGHIRADAEVPGQKATARVCVIGRVRQASNVLTLAFARQADMIALLGAVGRGNLDGSAWLSARGQKSHAPLDIDLAAELKLQRAVLDLAREGLLSSAHDISDGGLGQAIAESCIAGRIGCSVELPKVPGVSDLAMLFHEEPSRVVISFPPENREKVLERLSPHGVPMTMLGFVGGDTMEVEEVLEVPVHVLSDSYSRALEDLVGH